MEEIQPNVSRAATRKEQAEQTAKAGVKGSSSNVYERKWKNFKAFCMDENVQEGNGVVDPESSGQPNADIIGKIVEYFHYKISEEGCDPGEAINIRSALASVYKRRFHRIGMWKVNEDGTTEGTPTNSIVVNEAVQFYKREKKKKGSKSALPFRFKYMSRVWENAKEVGIESLYYSYLMAACSTCLILWLRIDELVKLRISDIEFSTTNEDGVQHHLIRLNDRKYLRGDQHGQSYAIYKLHDEECVCAFTHINTWITKYKSMLGREILPEDPLFPKSDERVSRIFFGERMVYQTFMGTINKIIADCGIVPRNAAGSVLGVFTSHCFRRGGAQHRFITGKARWPLDVVKWWGGWGSGEDVNTIIRYLLEETHKYENNFTHFLYTRGSDARLFNTHVATIADVGREVSSLQDKVSSTLLQLDQTAAANRMYLSNAVTKLGQEMNTRINSLEESLFRRLPIQLGSSSNHQVENSQPHLSVQVNSQVGNHSGAEGQTRPLYNHIPGVKTWKEVINQWETGCPSKNLTVPLKNWPRGTRTRGLKYKYHDRKLIAMEYLRLGEHSFLEKYCPDDCTLKVLKQKIRREHKENNAIPVDDDGSEESNSENRQ